jgi:hypothetical protein
MAPGTPGYYQFKGLCAGTYKVVIDNTQAALGGYTPTTTNAGGGSNPTIDSNPNPATVVLPTDTSVDETIDFGYSAVAPLTISCAPTTGQLNTLYNYAVPVTGGVSPYTFSASGLPSWLSINPTTGVLSGTPTSFGAFSFSVQVTDSSGLAAGTKSTNCSLTINPAPIAVQCATMSNAQVGVAITGQITATGGTGNYTYSIIGSLPPGLTLNSSTGVISGTPTAYGTFSWGVSVTDDHNNTASSGASSCTLVVAPSPISVICASLANAQVGVAISGQIVASGGTGGYTYSIIGSLPPGLTLDASTGVISGSPTSFGTYSWGVTVTDSQNHTASTAASACTLAVAPKPLSVLCASMANAQVGVAITGQIQATGGTGGYTYSIIGSLPAGLTLNASTGAISGTPTAYGTFSWGVKVTDSQSNTASTGATACTLVVAPKTLTVICAPGTTGQVGQPYSSAVAANGGTGGYTYTVANGALPAGLTLDTNTGLISGTPTAYGASSFTIQVKDSSGATATTGATNCTITIAPRPLTVQCAPATTGSLGSAYSSAAVTSGGTGGYTYSITAGALPAGLTLNPATGVISGTPTAYGTFSYTIQVKDSSGATASTGSTSCTLVIPPPSAPPITLNCGTCSAGRGTIGVNYSARLSVTGGLGPFTFSLVTGSSLPPGLTLNATTGLITGTPTAGGNYIFTVMVTDSTGQSDTVTCTVYIAVPPVNLDCGTCGTGRATVGSAYVSNLRVTGGTGPYKFDIVQGALPPGLTLNPDTGAITGTPTTPGTYNFTSRVTDSKGAVDTAYCSLIVVGSPVDLQCGVCGGARATIGVSFNEHLVVNGGSGPFTFSIQSGQLPGGLSLNTTTGVVSGTPTTAGTFTFTSKVVDANGNSDTVTCTITVSGPPVNLECGVCGTNSAKVGSPYSATLAVSGGKASFTFSVSSGSLPAGLTLNSSTGVVSGTPTTAGSYTVTFKVTDANGNTDTATCYIVVAGSALNIDCGTCNTKGTVGTAYSSMYSVTGGTGPYTFTITYGSLPPGLSLDKYIGKITGTPTTPGAYTFTAKVTDKNGNTDTQSCTLNVVAAPIDLQCGSCGSGNGTVGTAYNSTLTVVNGFPGYVFSLAPGSAPLPPGLTLNASTGVISGTPTTAGTYTFTTMVKDSHGNTDTATCTIVVINPAIDLQCGTCGNSKGTAGTAYTTTLVVVGGNGPFTFSMYNSSLPPGLSLNTTTGVISGTPTTAGTYTFTTKVVDKNGKTDTATCTLVVLPAPIDLQCGSCSSGKANVGVNYSTLPAVTGGVGALTYSLQSGSLPPGLSLNTTTGAISGTPNLAGSYTFTLKVVDSKGTSDTATCTIVVVGTVRCGDYTTYTQGGWGAPPNCNNPGGLLANNFSRVYPGGSVVIGGTYKLTFTSALAIQNFLPQGSTAAVLTGNATNPTNSVAGVFSGQVLALQLSVDFSNKGITPGGLSGLHVQSGALQGQTVAQVLALANSVLGGNTAALPSGLTVSGLVSILDSINSNFDGGSQNNGYLQ